MIRFVTPAILLFALSAQAAKPERGQLDASPGLFTVMAAINAAGYSADLSSPLNHPLRDAIRAELAKRKIPSLPALKQFFEQHRQANDTAELSQYISFALTADGPPNFEIKMRDVEVPPDVGPLIGLSPLLAEFYKEGDIEDLWNRSQPAIEQYLERYHDPISDAVLQVNAYLRQQTSGFDGRRFQIFICLQAAPNQIQTRSYGNNYTIVVTPSPDPRIFDIRHAYLHYLLDPMATRSQEILLRKSSLSDDAQRAEALADAYKQDFLLLATESLIKAVESRLDHKPQAVDAALHQGYILAPYFSEQLPIYEKQEEAMRFYYPDMVKAIDLLKEDARVSHVQFDKRAPVKTIAVAQPAAPPLTGAAKTMEEAEDHYRARELDKARKLYLDVLQQPDANSLHAQAYYGLARIAALQNDPESAERFFKKTLEVQPDAQTKAWTLVYLGRLSSAAGDQAQAAAYYRSALQVDGASPAAHQAAEQGVQQIPKQ
ncbi:MAG TPA: tetratricopeptide repeat protein [Bryobacteraceae bacterium]|nr:tetratricopeptide repeat protein [Bryobacteraceae bacterium]